MRGRAGDTAGAEAVYRLAVDRGDSEALRALAMRREQAGDLPALVACGASG
jgi:hypothetical protein